tara:strand:+ start:2114 stop:3442 length:1329 start_codon:yes stop_codon:yes gene_type:complete
MRTLIESLKAKHFPIQANDEAIYQAFHDHFRLLGINPDHCTLFANLTFLLTNRCTVDHLLKHLDKDVERLWHINEDSTASFNLHTPQEYKELVGLIWPSPKEELCSNHSRHLLSKALLNMEQRHGINSHDPHDAPVPTFVGYIRPKDAKKILENNQLWNEEAKLSPLFFHGKMTHRIQFYLIMKATEIKLLDIGDLSIAGLLQTLNQVSINGSRLKLAWDFLLDNVITNYNVVNVKPPSTQHLSILTEQYPQVIKSLTYKADYLYACDPFFLNAYLMSASRANTPYLSECVTQTFCKSAFAIQRMEKKLGVKSTITDYYLRNPYFSHATELLTDEDLEIENVLSRQAFTFSTAEVHLLQACDILDDQAATKNPKKINADRSIGSAQGVIQFRSLFTKPTTCKDNKREAPSPPKRHRSDSTSDDSSSYNDSSEDTVMRFGYMG